MPRRYICMENTNENLIRNNTVSRGSVLLSSPLLKDPTFKRSVVLILERDKNNGYLGLILNHQLDITLEDICNMPGTGDRMKVFSGGPVDLQRLFWLHTLGERLPGSFEVLPGLYVGGDYNKLIKAFSEKKSLKNKIRFYLGYSGWVAGQLEKEIDIGAWATLEHPLDPKMLIDVQGDEMWHSLVSQMGERYRHWLMIPSDPALN